MIEIIFDKNNIININQSNNEENDSFLCEERVIRQRLNKTDIMQITNQLDIPLTYILLQTI